MSNSIYFFNSERMPYTSALIDLVGLNDSSIPKVQRAVAAFFVAVCLLVTLAMDGAYQIHSKVQQLFSPKEEGLKQPSRFQFPKIPVEYCAYAILSIGMIAAAFIGGNSPESKTLWERIQEIALFTLMGGTVLFVGGSVVTGTIWATRSLSKWWRTSTHRWEDVKKAWEIAATWTLGIAFYAIVNYASGNKGGNFNFWQDYRIFSLEKELAKTKSNQTQPINFYVYKQLPQPPGNNNNNNNNNPQGANYQGQPGVNQQLPLIEEAQ